MKDRNNYMVYVGHDGARYSEYRDLCIGFNVLYDNSWWGNTEYYGMLEGRTKALCIDEIDEYNVEILTMTAFEEAIKDDMVPNVDNFSII